MISPIPLESLLPDRAPSSHAPDRRGLAPPAGPNGNGNGNGNGRHATEVPLPIGPPLRVDPAFEDLQLAPTRGMWSKKARLLKAFLLGRPVWVTWQVTYNCNYGCSFCTYWQNDFQPHEENSLEDFRIGAEKLSEMGSLIVSLAGGEPMLRRDIHQIVDVKIGRASCRERV